MGETAKTLCEMIQGAKCAYIQSDEISILLIDYDQLTTQAWFDYNLQKIVSVSAAIASSVFTQLWGSMATFDSRAFNIPREEVCNYFVWRQKDWIRNSVQMLAQSNFSHNQLQNKGQVDMHEMLHEIGINWADLEPHLKNGNFVIRAGVADISCWQIQSAPIFKTDRQSIEKYLNEPAKSELLSQPSLLE
jgi:tRNA(His) 5'-end guanylyltransferase